MVVLVPVEEPAGFPNYEREDYGIMDEMAYERKRFGDVSRSASQTASVRTTTSVENGIEGDGGIGLKRPRKGRNDTPMRVGREDDETQLYAEYLRSSSSTESSREGQIKARDRSENKARVRNNSVVAEIRERDGVGNVRRRRDSSATEAKFELQRRRNGMVTESVVQMPMREVLGSSSIPGT